MKIYLADLAEYVSGRITGDWLDLDTVEDANDIWEVVNSKILRFGHDEVAIHDYDNFPNLGEYPSFEKVIEVRNLIRQFDLEVVQAFIEYLGFLHNELIFLR